MQIDSLLNKAKNQKVLNQGLFKEFEEIYHHYIKELYYGDNLVVALKRRKILYKFWIDNNVSSLNDAKNITPMCRICNSEYARPSVNNNMDTCSKPDCIKAISNLKKEEVFKNNLELMQSKTIDELLDIFHSKKSNRTPFGWLTWIAPHYLKFAKEIYSDDVLNDFGIRMDVLYKYWAGLKIRTLDDAKQSILSCSYCHNNPRIPRITGSIILECCHNKSCMIKNNVDATKNAMKNKYGVDNISSLDSMKKLKSEKMKKNYEEHGSEIIAKRIITIQDRYGDDCINVSQIEDVKEKKKQTFQDHYGKDNIFQRSDLMKEYWLKALGVENPKFDSAINAIRVKNCIKGLIEKNGTYIKIDGKDFGILESLEGYVLNLLSEVINMQFVSSNEIIFEKTICGKSEAYVPDIAFSNVYMEVKNGMRFITVETVNRVLDFIDITQNYVIFFITNVDSVYIASSNFDGTFNVIGKNVGIKDLLPFGDKIKSFRNIVTSVEEEFKNQILKITSEEFLSLKYFQNNISI